MPAIWTTPRTWASGDPITAIEMNKQRDNMEYLFKRPRDIVNYTSSSNISITSTSMDAVDDSIFTLETIFTGGMAYIWFNGQFFSSTSGAYLVLDVLVDDNNYLSSNASSPLANGIVRQGIIATSANVGISFGVVYNQALSGSHNFKLRAYRVTGAVQLSGNVYTQFGVLEI
jgi:hypothetical protein